MGHRGWSRRHHLSRADAALAWEGVLPQEATAEERRLAFRRAEGQTKEQPEMELRFYEDPDTGLPHIDGHDVTEAEVRQVLRARGEDLPARSGSPMKLGPTASGRYLQVIDVPDEAPDSLFVITAYELRGKGKTAFRRRQRRKPRCARRDFRPVGTSDACVRCSPTRKTRAKTSNSLRSRQPGRRKTSP